MTLKLLAEDADDLAVISAALQDSIGKIGDIRFSASARQLTLVLNRYRWEGERRTRVGTALQLGSVLSVKSRNLRRTARSAVVELLAIGFEAGDPPGGLVTFSFAGGGDLKVEVECLDVILADITGSWGARTEPSHEGA